MPADNSRLDRLLSKKLNIKRKLIKPLIAKGTVQVNQKTVFDVQMPVNQFSHVSVDGKIIQDKQAYYLMLNKPKGVVSATKDKVHPTVIGLINLKFRDELRIVGRLDFNTTGLMLLTNDTDWAHSLSYSGAKVMKRYKVSCKEPIDFELYQQGFTDGILLSPEKIITAAAKLTAINSHQAYIEISEGKYHQVKRMFGYFDNEVLELHRESIGNYELCDTLAPGEFKLFQPTEPSSLIRR